MQRRTVPERPDWRAEAERVGFVFQTINDEPYWDERACYVFSLDEIEATR